MKWSFNRKRPTPIKIESSDEWKNFSELGENYLIWIGHSTFLINIEGTIVLTDPVFSDRASPVKIAGPKRIIPPAMRITDLPEIDVVTVSHNHYDHLDLPTLRELAKRDANTKFYVPLGNGDLLRKADITDVHELDWGQTVNFGSIVIHCLPARHWSKRSITPESAVHRRPVATPRAPASRIRPSSAISQPSSPRVAAASGCTQKSGFPLLAM